MCYNSQLTSLGGIVRYIVLVSKGYFDGSLKSVNVPVQVSRWFESEARTVRTYYCRLVDTSHASSSEVEAP